MIASGTDPRRVATAVRELRQVHRELVERDLVRRADALEEVQQAVEELAEFGSAAAILERAAENLGRNSSFERILVSQVDGDRLVPHSFWARSGSPAAATDRIREVTVTLRYPLAEAEVMRRGGAAVVVAADGPRSPAELRELLGWRSYVVAPIRLRARPIGLLHAEPARGDEPDREAAEIYASGLAAAFERAVLRDTVQHHRTELRAAAAEIGDHLSAPATVPELAALEEEPESRRSREQEKLTRRESEILKMLGRGQTSAAIATSLLISESTVKFHVKNILLKLGATSRADAVARHLRGGG